MGLRAAGATLPALHALARRLCSVRSIQARWPAPLQPSPEASSALPQPQAAATLPWAPPAGGMWGSGWGCALASRSYSAAPRSTFKLTPEIESRLHQVLLRSAELSSQLTAASTRSTPLSSAALQALQRDYARVQPLADTFAAWLRTRQELQEAQQLWREAGEGGPGRDVALSQLAAEEAEVLTHQLEQLEQELEQELLPQDELDGEHCNHSLLLLEHCTHTAAGMHEHRLRDAPQQWLPLQCGHASCSLPHAPCPMPHAAMLHAPCPMPHATCHMPHTPCHMPHATCHMLRVPCLLPGVVSSLVCCGMCREGC